jgi:protein involved in polysaccharide export with SLBB domain
MKDLRNCAGRSRALLGLLAAGFFMAGCQSQPPRFAEVPQVSEEVRTVVDPLRVGDPVTITFSSTSPLDPVLQPFKETIKEDGTITPPVIGSVVAAGRTLGDLQKDLQEKYNKYYNNVTVTVVAENRFYYVTGDVRKPGPEPYLGETDIIKAIAAAGDFTDFANKKKVRLTRANGQSQVINVKKILDDPQFDVPIYPGDKIYVPRRYW